MWNISEHGLRAFTLIDNNNQLLIFQQVDVYLKGKQT